MSTKSLPVLPPIKTFSVSVKIAATSVPVVPTREVMPSEPTTVEKANVLLKLKHDDHKVAFAAGQQKYLEAVTATELGFCQLLLLFSI